MIKKSQGPCLVPCGTPDGTVPHSDTQPSESLILCERADRKSIIQLMTLEAMSSAHNFLTKILWYQLLGRFHGNEQNYGKVFFSGTNRPLAHTARAQDIFKRLNQST